VNKKNVKDVKEEKKKVHTDHEIKNTKEMTDEMYYCKTRTNREIIMEFQKGNHSNAFKRSVRVRLNETKSIPCKIAYITTYM